ncbi:geranyltranstransferase [Legionella nautarum]|uniref:Geranyltranstransferase n=1 Tax=Legionella nautarum TaxID=45070 RepID=A0A0W0X2P1_9GAMM|nr:farnesyl diphosphate synthase [Legionella nautarum]KTD38853.1 geranyltranstransferase [Legionella nautarum]
MINQEISNYLVRHEEVLQQLLADAGIPADRIRKAMAYSLFPGGKRLRPILIYLCGEILNTQLSNLDVIAAAVELTHCYSLIHDDLPAMDNDDLRRGKPSCHRAFDEATAILVGDGMQALAIDILLSYLPKSLNPMKVIDVTRELVIASGPAGMVSGQSLDLSELTNTAISEGQLRTIHSLKTGKLILACVNMVVAASEPAELAVKALRDFADHLGFVFQIQDDYLDHYAQADLLGKGRASDLANQKMTFASLYTRDELEHLIKHHFQLARDALRPLGHQAEHLLALTDYLHQRNNLS